MDRRVPTLRQGLALYAVVLGLVLLPGSLMYYAVGEFWQQPLLAALLMQLCFVVLPLFVAARAFSWDVASAFRLVPVRPSVAALAVLASVSFVPAAELIEEGVETLLPVPSFLEEMFRGLLQADSVPDWAMTLLTVALVPGFGEELLFRGAILQAVARHLTPFRSVVAAALLFAFMHLNPWQFAGALVLGSVYGLMVWWSGSIIPAMLAHAANNSCFIVLSNLIADGADPLGTRGRVIAVVVGTAVTATCLLGIRARGRRETAAAVPAATDPSWPH